MWTRVPISPSPSGYWDVEASAWILGYNPPASRNMKPAVSVNNCARKKPPGRVGCKLKPISRRLVPGTAFAGGKAIDGKPAKFANPVRGLVRYAG